MAFAPVVPVVTRSPRPGRAVVPLLLALTLGACSSAGRGDVTVVPSLPGPHGPLQQGRFVWYDLITEDVDRTMQFYSGLFGWEFQEEADGLLHVARSNGRRIASIVDVRETEQDVDGGAWFSSVSVENVDAAVRLGGARGSINVPPTELPDRGRYAVINDPQGAVFVVLRAAAGDPVEPETIGFGEFLWTELWTTDARAAVGYYESVLGYTSELLADDARQYHLMSRDGEPRAGIGQLPPGDAEPAWLPYVAVSDAAEIVRRVPGLGGSVLIAPDAMVRGSAAVIADPSGAIFAVQEWPLPDESGDARRGGSR